MRALLHLYLWLLRHAPSSCNDPSMHKRQPEVDFWMAYVWICIVFPNILIKSAWSNSLICTCFMRCCLQVPQFLLDEWLLNWDSNSKKHVEIVCTQPRRISAIGVAERVSEERVERIGNTVGYQVRCVLCTMLKPVWYCCSVGYITVLYAEMGLILYFPSVKSIILPLLLSPVFLSADQCEVMHAIPVVSVCKLSL